MIPKIIVLGAQMAGDDGAALAAAAVIERRLEPGRAHLVLAGRPGPALLDHLDGPEPVLLLDVIRAGLEPGELLELTLAELREAVVVGAGVSSHGFAAGEALRLGQVLGRPLPAGRFIGVEGHRFDPGPGLTPAVEAAVPQLADRAIAAIDDLEESRCTSLA